MTDINPILDHPLFAAFFQASPDMLYVHGPDGRLIDVNPQVEKVTGFSREELLTLPPERLMGEGYRLEEALDRLARARAGEAQDFTWMARTRSGEEFPVEVRLRPLALDEPGYVLALVRDLRLHRDNQEAHRKRWDILRRIAAAERESLDPDTILTRVIDAVRDMFQADRAYLLYPCDPEEDFWSVPVQASAPEYPPTPGGTHPFTPRTRQIAREALQAGGAMPFYLMEADREWGGDQYGIRSGLVVVVRPRLGKPWMLGIYQCSYRREWTQTEQALLTELAERVAPLLDALAEQRQRSEQDSRLHHFLQVLAEVARNRVIDAGDLHEALYPYTEAGTRALGVARVSVWMMDEGHRRLRCVDLYQGGDHQRGETLDAKDYPSYFAALETDRVLAVHDARHDLHTRDFLRRYLLPNEVGALLDVPVRIGGELAGVLRFEHRGGPRVWTPSEQAFAASLADQVALVVDYWRRREAEAALSAQIRLNQALLQSTPVGFILLDTEGVIREVNPAYARMVGYSQEALVGRHIQSLEMGGADSVAENLTRILERGRVRLEARHRHQEGHGVDLDMNISVLEDGTRPLLAAFVMDVSGRRAREAGLVREVAHQAERLAQANEVLRDLAREPGPPAHAAQAEGAERDRRQRMQAGVRRVGKLVSELMVLVRLPRRRRVDLTGLARDVAREVAAGDGRRQVQWEIQEGLSHRADPGLLRVVLEQLFANAWAFTAGVRKARIRFGMREVDGEPVYFVEDNGPGADLERVRKRLRRGARAEGRMGVGSGLETVARLVAHHQGKVWVGAGDGATFCFTLG